MRWAAVSTRAERPRSSLRRPPARDVDICARREVRGRSRDGASVTVASEPPSPNAAGLKGWRCGPTARHQRPEIDAADADRLEFERQRIAQSIVGCTARQLPSTTIDTSLPSRRHRSRSPEGELRASAAPATPPADPILTSDRRRLGDLAKSRC
jgi:hypothetical protein